MVWKDIISLMNKYYLDVFYLFLGGDSGLDGLGGPGVQPQEAQIRKNARQIHR